MRCISISAEVTMINNQQQLIDYVKSKLKAGVRDKSSEQWLASNNIKIKSVTQITKSNNDNGRTANA